MALMSGKYNSNTSTMSSQQANSVDGLVFDYYRYALDAIIKDRKAKINPIISASQISTPMQPGSLSVQPIDHIGYINNTLHGWRKSLSKPMSLDIYLFHSQLQQHILIERWTFTYHQLHDFASNLPSTKKESSSSSSRIYATVNRRIQTLVRSLYCFVRLLPGFNLLHLSAVEPFISLQLYDSKNVPSQFIYEPSKQQFPIIPTTKGKLSTTVHFIHTMHVMEIIKAINNGAIIGNIPGMIDRESNKTASVPIPINGKKEGSGSHPTDSHHHRSRSYHDDPYRKSFQRPSISGGGDVVPNVEAERHARSFESTLPITQPVDIRTIESITGQRRSSGTIEAGDMNIPPSVGYSFGSTPRSSVSVGTPPFAYNLQDDNSEGTSIEMTGPSPPYSHNSPSSLHSHSPHLMAMTDRRPSLRKSQPQVSGSWGRSFNTATTLFHFADYDKLRPKITLPISPFLINQSNTSSNSNSNGSQSQLAMITDSRHPSSSNQSNKLDFLIQLEKEKERQLSEIYIDHGFDRSRSISGMTKDEDHQEKLRDLLDPTKSRPSFSIRIEGEEEEDEELPFATPLPHSSDIASSIYGLMNQHRYGSSSYGNSHYSTSLIGNLNDSTTYFSLPSISGELQQKLQEFKQFHSQITQRE